MQDLKGFELQYSLGWQDRAWLSHVARYVKAECLEQSQFNARAQALFNAQVNSVHDASGQANNLMCAYLLALYQDTQTQVANAFQKIENMFSGFGRFWMKFFMRVSIMMGGASLAKIEDNAVKRMRDIYGEGFSFEIEKSEDSFVTVINKSGFYNFMHKAGEPELTKVLCKWDMI